MGWGRSVMLLGALALGACKNKPSGPDDASQPPAKQMIDVREQFEGDPSRVTFFVEQIAAVSLKRIEPWSEARARLFLKLEPNDYDFHGALHWPVSPRVDRLLTLSAPRSTSLRWVTQQMLDDWGVTLEQAEQAAGENLDRLLGSIRLEVDPVDGHKLGMVPLDSPFKASVILAPHFRAFVEKELGWPVLAVTPCRDFIYLYDNDEDFARRGGPVVLEEYSTSGYPITTELWRISDGGLEAIDAFGPVRSPGPERDLRTPSEVQ
jgi:hypothetical protein